MTETTTPLDPAPWRILFGPWGGTRVDILIPDAEFDPRPDYSQNREDYA